MRTDQLRLLCAALTIFALLAAPIALAGSSDQSGASQRAAKHKPGIAAELKKLKKKLAALEKSAQEKASTQALQAAIADWEKNTEGVSGGFARLEAPLGGVLTGAFPGNVQIVDEGITGPDIAIEAIGSASVNPNQIQLRSSNSSCSSTGKVNNIRIDGVVECGNDLGSRGQSTVTSTADTTPTIGVLNVLNLSYTGATVVTDLDGGAAGQPATLIAGNGNVSIADGGNFRLSAAWAPNADDTLTLVLFGSTWFETDRSAN